MGRLIVIEGGDGCGKETQSKLLENYLKEIKEKVLRLSFPSYGTKQAGPVEMFLDGELGDRDKIDPVTISNFYAIDRACTMYQKNIKSLLEEGYWIICDRYVESNIIYQTAMVEDTSTKNVIIKEIKYLEYDLMGIPVPDDIIYLDLNRTISKKLIDSRGEKKDINEKNELFMERVHQNGKFLAEKYKWKIINCDDGENILSFSDIHLKILRTLHID